MRITVVITIVILPANDEDNSQSNPEVKTSTLLRVDPAAASEGPAGIRNHPATGLNCCGLQRSLTNTPLFGVNDRSV